MSVVKLNVYEGVPVGGNNFEDVLNYIRGFLGANFGFSTNTLSNQGGYFQGDEFVYKTKPSTAGNSARFFVPNTKPVGNLFGQYGNEYYRFEVQTFSSDEPQVNTWTLLATQTKSPSLTQLVFETLSATDKQLPYRPLYQSTGDGLYRQGYQSVRFNGIPQDAEDYSVSFTPVTGFQTQSLQINLLRLGAEQHRPIIDGRYDGLIHSDEIDNETLISSYNSHLTFEFTNFSIESGGHILLWRQDGGQNRFVYVPQYLSSLGQLPSGFYRVVDFARGIIEINLSVTQLEQLRLTGEGTPANELPFKVISAEQLREDTASGVTSYMSRFGGVYNGSTTDVILVEYIYDGTTHIAREILSSEYSGASGDILLQDVNQSYTDGVILAIQYYGTPNQNELREAQSNRYRPDTFQLYYHSGIIFATGDNNDNVRSIVELNPASWYNRDIFEAEYYPVNRAEEAFYSLIFASEASHFGIAFDPNQSFEIVDTISLLDLSDIGSVSAGQVLVYDGAVFNGVNYALSQLSDVSFTGIANNHVLQRVGGVWTNRTPTQVMTSTNLTSLVRYSAAHAVNPGDDFALVHKSYVDQAISNLSGGITPQITDHINNTTTAHGADTEPTNNTIARRNGQGRLQSAQAVGINGSTNADTVLTLAWIRDGTNAGSSATANILVRRDSNGRILAQNPATVLSTNTSPSVQQVLTANWLTNASNSTPNATNNTLVRRDNNGRFQSSDILTSSPGTTVVNKNWLGTRNYMRGNFSSASPYSVVTISSGTYPAGTQFQTISHGLSESTMPLVSSAFIPFMEMWLQNTDMPFAPRLQVPGTISRFITLRYHIESYGGGGTEVPQPPINLVMRVMVIATGNFTIPANQHVQFRVYTPMLTRLP